MKEQLKTALYEGLVLAGVLSILGGLTGLRRPDEYSYLEWMLPLVGGGVVILGVAYVLHQLMFVRPKRQKELS